MRSIGRCVFLSILLVTAVAAAAQPLYRAGTRLVTVHVSVVDRLSRPVDGLTADRFQVFEDGQRRPVAVFADATLPLDVGVLLDTSGSMGIALPLVQQAAVEFVRALRPIDRATIVGLSSRTPVLQSMTDDKAALERAIRKTVARGETPLYITVYAALRMLTGDSITSPGHIRRQALIVLSDGFDTGRAFGFSELLTIAHRHAVPIYVVAPRGSEEQNERTEAALDRSIREIDFELRRLATDTGGRAFFPKAFHELSGIYDDIARELAYQYAIGYYASDDTRGSRFRRLSVNVTVPDVAWRARTGYVAEP